VPSYSFDSPVLGKKLWRTSVKKGPKLLACSGRPALLKVKCFSCLKDLKRASSKNTELQSDQLWYSWYCYILNDLGSNFGLKTFSLYLVAQSRKLPNLQPIAAVRYTQPTELLVTAAIIGTYWFLVPWTGHRASDESDESLREFLFRFFLC